MKNKWTWILFFFGLIHVNLYGQSGGKTNKKIKHNQQEQSSQAVERRNPICPPGLYIADPEVRVMPDGRVYLYGSRDEPGNAWCSRSYNVLSTSDLVKWEVEQTSFATDGVGKQTD